MVAAFTLIINQMHLIRDDDDSKDVIELQQQRAEQWAAPNLVTMVFNSDDYCETGRGGSG